MGPAGNNFNYFSENKLTKFANLVQFKRKPMLMFRLEDWGPLANSSCLRHLQRVQHFDSVCNLSK